MKFWPGEFVRTIVQLKESKDSIVIPAAAVQTSQEGKFVFIVKSDMTVESRSVSIGRTVGGFIVVQGGLVAGDTVVTDGQLRLSPGAKVRVKS